MQSRKQGKREPVQAQSENIANGSCMRMEVHSRITHTHMDSHVQKHTHARTHVYQTHSAISLCVHKHVTHLFRPGHNEWTNAYTYPGQLWKFKYHLLNYSHRIIFQTTLDNALRWHSIICVPFKSKYIFSVACELTHLCSLNRKFWELITQYQVIFEC